MMHPASSPAPYNAVTAIVFDVTDTLRPISDARILITFFLGFAMHFIMSRGFCSFHQYLHFILFLVTKEFCVSFLVVEQSLSKKLRRKELT